MLYGSDKLGNNHCILGGYLLARWPVLCKKSFCVSSDGEKKTVARVRETYCTDIPSGGGGGRKLFYFLNPF